MTASQLAIALLGEFSMTLAGKPTASFAGDRPISLLAYLLLHRHTAVNRQHLAFTLWPDTGDSQARANLRNLFFNLRQTMPQADNYLAADSMTLQWRNDADFTLDVADFETALAAAKTAAPPQTKSVIWKRPFLSTKATCCLAITTIGSCHCVKSCANNT
jgi:DNA-binding SARP family transcriptional activator